MQPRNTQSHLHSIDDLNMLLKLNVCDVGEIVGIDDDDMPQQALVEIGYICNTAIRVGTQETKKTIKCSVLTINHNAVPYKVGDLVFVAYTNRPNKDYIINNEVKIYGINETNGLHSENNGVVLFSFNSYLKDTNKQVRIWNNKAEIIIQNENDDGSQESITIKNNDKGDISFDKDGNIILKNQKCSSTLDKDGNIELKNNNATITIKNDGEIILTSKKGGEISIADTISLQNQITDLKTTLKQIWTDIKSTTAIANVTGVGNLGAPVQSTGAVTFTWNDVASTQFIDNLLK